VGCTSNLERGDRFFDARAYRDAVASYEKAIHAGEAEPHLERVLFHLALAYALPGSPLHDERRARELLEELVGRIDSGPYRSQAARILELEELEAELRDEAARHRREITELEAALLGLSWRGEDDKSTIDELRLALERLDTEIAKCREQLEKLKAIDVEGSLDDSL
jgi:DNA repair exonuclease SbcCD ATPase subunit